MANEPLNQIYQAYHENRLSHAFLIETNDQEKCFQDLKKILSMINCESDYQESCIKCNLCHLIEIETLPSLVVIRPDGMTIRKDQVLELKNKFSTKPIYSKYNMYVIMNAEKLNNSSANTILKFLEEPEEGIVGFFITNNKENIIDTIKSRCQILSNFYEFTEIVNEKIEEYAFRLIKEAHLSEDMALLSNKELLSSDLSKDDYQKIFQYMIRIYFYFYEQQFVPSIDSIKYKDLQFLMKKSADYLLKQLNLVQTLEEELTSNVNMNLLLDRFILETR